MTDDTDTLGRLIVKVAGVLAGDEETDCPWSGQAGKLVDSITTLLDAFSILIPDPDEHE